MQKRYPLISLYDAHSDKEIFGDPQVVSRAHNLAQSLAKAKLGTVGRIGSQVVTTILATLTEHGVSVVGISPAATEREHQVAYRLPHVSFPTIFSGRGALGADVMALSSSHGVLIAGSDEESLLGVLGCVGDRGIPIGIFTYEDPTEVRRRINNRYPNLMLYIFVSNEPDKLVHDIAFEMRKQHMEKK